MRRATRFLGLLVTLLSVYSSPSVLAQDCPELVGRWPYGPSSEVEASDGLVFYGSGAAFMVADISNPVEPTVIASLTLPYGVGDIEVRNGLAYVTDSDAKLNVINLSNPARPILVGVIRVPSPTAEIDVDIVGDLAIVTAWTDLVFVDVSNPWNPVLVGALRDATEWPFGQLEIEHAAQPPYSAYVSALDGLHIFNVDIDRPENSTEVGFLDFSDGPGPGKFAVADGFAYINHWTELLIVDVRDPTEPVLVGGFEDEGYEYSDVAVDGDLAYLGGGAFAVVDVSDPRAPQELGSVDDDMFLTRLAISGEVVVGAGGPIVVFDVSAPAEPVHASSFNSIGTTSDAHMVGNRLLVHREGLRVFDIADPSDLVEIGSCDLEVRDLTVSGTHAYVVGADYDTSTFGLFSVDLSNPAAPEVVGVNTWVDGSQITALGDHVYVTGWAEGFGLHICDISTPESPGLTGSYPIVEPTAVRLAGDRAHVTHRGDDYNGGVYVINVADPETPVEESYLPLPRPCCSDLSVSKGFAYVDAYYNLHVVDVRIPSQPSFVNTIPVSYPHIVGVSGSLLLVCGEGNSYLPTRGLYVIDVSNPMAPVSVGSWFSKGRDDYLEAGFQGRYAYVTNPYEGILVFDLSGCPGFQPAPFHPRRSSGRRVSP